MYDTLCTAFSCGFDAIVPGNETNPMALYKLVEAVGPVQMQSAFKTSYSEQSRGGGGERGGRGGGQTGLEQAIVT